MNRRFDITRSESNNSPVTLLVHLDTLTRHIYIVPRALLYFMSLRTHCLLLSYLLLSYCFCFIDSQRLFHNIVWKCLLRHVSHWYATLRPVFLPPFSVLKAEATTPPSLPPCRCSRYASYALPRRRLPLSGFRCHVCRDSRYRRRRFSYQPTPLSNLLPEYRRPDN